MIINFSLFIGAKVEHVCCECLMFLLRKCVGATPIMKVKILFSFVFALLCPFQIINKTQHKIAWQDICVRFYATYGIDA